MSTEKIMVHLQDIELADPKIKELLADLKGFRHLQDRVAHMRASLRHDLFPNTRRKFMSIEREGWDALAVLEFWLYKYLRVGQAEKDIVLRVDWNFLGELRAQVVMSRLVKVRDSLKECEEEGLEVMKEKMTNGFRKERLQPIFF